VSKRAAIRAAAVACAIAVVVGGNAAAAAAGSASTTGAPGRTSAAVRLKAGKPYDLAGNLAERLGIGGPERLGLPRWGQASVRLDGSPGVPVANPRTNTVYVPIQCTNPSTTASCTRTANRDVEVINAADCNAENMSDCRVVAKATVGKSPFAAVIDERTDTIYTANAIGSVSVLDGATCNATVTSGCHSLATIRTGGFPFALAFDPTTATLYVASIDGGVFVVDVANCDAITTSGCEQPVKTIKDSKDPDSIALDVATDTVYAANGGPTGNGDTVSVINGATCNGHDGSGCNRPPGVVAVGTNPTWDVVDQRTDTIYVASYNDGTVSVIDGGRCNAHVRSGCHSTPLAVPTGSGLGSVAIDSSLHTLFAMNQNDDTLSEINTNTCKGTVTSGCPPRARNRQAVIPPGGYGASSLAIMDKTATAYLVDFNGQRALSVMSIKGCTAVDTTRCRLEAPSVPDPEYQMTADPATDTIYATNLVLPEIDVLNGATCDPKAVSGCAVVAEIPVAGFVGDVDDATHTLYASEYTGTNEVAVINTATCNAHDTTGCATPAPTITVGAFPGTPALNAVTRTLYVPYGDAGRNVAVVNAATCNAEVTSGCGQKPAVVKVGAFTEELAVSAKTDTVYAPSFTTGDTVAVINGATCNGTDHSGCGHLAATVNVGLYPFGIAVDDATQTVYVANNTNGDSAGTVSVINGATCNGSDPAGCNGTMPTIEVGRSPLFVALNTRTDTLYVGDYSSAAVSVVNGSKCNATVTTGCRRPAPERAVGSQPFGLAVNPYSSTVYVGDIFGSGAMSMFDGRP
jgi:DNA-binding beta-propeller fold protein YncE